MLNRVDFLFACALQFDVLKYFADIVRVRRLCVFSKVAHLQLPGLLIDPEETLFELILQGPILNILEISILLAVGLHSLIKVGDLFRQFLNFTGIIFDRQLHFLVPSLHFLVLQFHLPILLLYLGYLLPEDLALVFLFGDNLLHGLILLPKVGVFPLEALPENLTFPKPGFQLCALSLLGPKPDLKAPSLSLLCPECQNLVGLLCELLVHQLGLLFAYRVGIVGLGWTGVEGWLLQLLYHERVKLLEEFLETWKLVVQA